MSSNGSPSYVMLRADASISGDQATSEMVIRQCRELSTIPKTPATTERAKLRMVWAFASGQALPAFGSGLRLCGKKIRLEP